MQRMIELAKLSVTGAPKSKSPGKKTSAKDDIDKLFKFDQENEKDK